MSEQRFEDELAQVEDIVRRLERGEIGLDEALQLFEDGIARLRKLETRLSEVESRVRAVMEQAGMLVEEPFDPEQGN
jgi:exodeoxyribonuclease VII small subunit